MSNTFPFMSFLSSFGKKKAEQGTQAAAEFLVNIDPKAASGAQMLEYEKEFNKATDNVAKLRQEFCKEKAEADKIRAQYNQGLAAAELLQKKLDAANEEAKPGLEKSLDALLKNLESLAPEVEREEREANEAEEMLSKFEEAAKELRDRLLNAKAEIKNAQKRIERADLDKQRNEQLAQQAAQLQGLRDGNNHLGVAISAMERIAAEKEKQAASSKFRAELLKKDSTGDVSQDKNIAQAMREVSGQAATPVSPSDRLAALKKKATPVAV